MEVSLASQEACTHLATHRAYSSLFKCEGHLEIREESLEYYVGESAESARLATDLRPMSQGFRALFHNGHSLQNGLDRMVNCVEILKQAVLGTIVRPNASVPRICTLLVFLIPEVDLELHHVLTAAVWELLLATPESLQEEMYELLHRSVTRSTNQHTRSKTVEWYLSVRKLLQERPGEGQRSDGYVPLSAV